MSQASSAAELPQLAIFPLANVALFPQAGLPLHVFEPRYRAMIRDVLAHDGLLAIARLEPGFEADYEGRPPVNAVCGVGRIEQSHRLEDGRYDILLRGLWRARIVEELPASRPYRVVRARQLQDVTHDDTQLGLAWQTRLSALWRELAPHLPAAVRDLEQLVGDRPDAGAFADRIAAVALADPDDRQRLLEELDPAERLRLLVERLQDFSDAVSGRGRTPSELN